jgi:hypothetical protein
VTRPGKPALRLAGGSGLDDAVVRKHRFEAAHPDAVILPPAPERWRAVFAGRTIGSWDLDGLMDQLEKFPPRAKEPPAIGDGLAGAPAAGTLGAAGWCRAGHGARRADPISARTPARHGNGKTSLHTGINDERR